MRNCTKTWSAAAVLAVAAIACEKSATDTSQQSSPPAQTTTAAPATSPVTNTNGVVQATPDPLDGVANRDRLTLDPNATAITPPKPAVLVTGLSTTVRESPRGSKIEVLETTANVREVERDGDYFLVTYADPKGSGRMLAGWVHRDGLVGEGWSAKNPTVAQPRLTGKLACAHGETHLLTTDDFCGKVCKDDRDCDAKKGEICDGVAFKVNESNDHHEDARFCISNASPGANEAHGVEHGSSKNLPVHK